MFKSGMHCSGVHLIGPGELPDAPEPLKRRLADNIHFPVVGLNEAVYRATDLVSFVRVQAPNNFRSFCSCSIGEEKAKNNNDAWTS